MLVSEVMTKNPILIDTGYTILDVAKKMCDEECGVLPVMEGDAVTGIVTDRDITIYATAKEIDVANTPITEIMSKEVLACREDELLENIADRMSINDVRRLVVYNEQRKVVGIVSIHDLMVNIGDEKMTDEVIHHVLKYA